MNIRIWLERGFGRVREGTRRHLIESAKLLDFEPGMVDQLVSATDEQCELLFINRIEEACGGVVDWRSSSAEVVDVIQPFLNSNERTALDTLALSHSARPAEVARQIDIALRQERVGVRAMDTFGDSIIIVAVQKKTLKEFTL